MHALANIDVPDLAAAVAFYTTTAFGLSVSRRLGPAAAELSGWRVPLYLLEKPAGSIGAPGARRHYDRHWTPVHLDIVVDDLDAALARALEAGARAETAVRTETWGRNHRSGRSVRPRPLPHPVPGPRIRGDRRAR